MYLKIFIFLFVLLYQNGAYSKITNKNDFNQKYLSNYFSALVSSSNQKNDDAIRFFNSSKFLINKHDNFLKEYLYSLILDGKVKKAIKQTKRSNNLKFFESNLLLTLDSLTKKKYSEAAQRLKKLSSFQQNGTYEFVIIKTLESYNYLFLNKKVKNKNQNLGRIDLITDAFQNCYLNSNKAHTHFLNLINSPESDYSRYLFFYLGNIIENKDFKTANEISKTIDPLKSSLLIAQVKIWVEANNYYKFSDYFSCNNENDLLAEFFFLISNLYSSEDQFKKSNFYLNISNYLNPKFYFNLSLIVENYHLNDNFELAKNVLQKFTYKDEIYEWYKTKKVTQFLIEQKSNKIALNYIEKKINNLKNPSNKILFDIANIYKKFKDFEKAIYYYSLVLSNIENNSSTHADVLYRRGGSYERMEDYEKADIDLLKSLEIKSDDPYTLNYLAYSWLERNYKINEAIKMLEKAYKEKENDPYITDSVGWGYYLIGDYKSAEKYLRRAVELMPEDPIVNDHYGDVLWKLNRKMQANYFWKNVLKFEDTEEKMKKDIKNKLLNGPSKI
ncbi:MAG: tetratricopeptide repeat protein [Candidatus Pelagibacter sp.]